VTSFKNRAECRHIETGAEVLTDAGEGFIVERSFRMRSVFRFLSLLLVVLLASAPGMAAQATSQYSSGEYAEADAMVHSADGEPGASQLQSGSGNPQDEAPSDSPVGDASNGEDKDDGEGDDWALSARAWRGDYRFSNRSRCPVPGGPLRNHF